MELKIPVQIRDLSCSEEVADSVLFMLTQNESMGFPSGNCASGPTCSTWGQKKVLASAFASLQHQDYGIRDEAVKWIGCSGPSNCRHWGFELLLPALTSYFKERLRQRASSQLSLRGCWITVQVEVLMLTHFWSLFCSCGWRLLLWLIRQLLTSTFPWRQWTGSQWCTSSSRSPLGWWQPGSSTAWGSDVLWVGVFCFPEEVSPRGSSRCTK